METTTEPKAAKPKRPSKLKQLADQLALAQAEVQKQAQLLADKARADERQAAEMRELRDRLKLASEVLKPFHEKTKDWEGQWPSDSIAVTRKLTFGDLRRASEAFAALNK